MEIMRTNQTFINAASTQTSSRERIFRIVRRAKSTSPSELVVRVQHVAACGNPHSVL
jgi:hypothetical protein